MFWFRDGRSFATVLHRHDSQLHSSPRTVSLQSHAQNATVSDEMLEKLLDRTHLAAKAAPPYPASGPGYELVAAQAGGLLSSVD